MEENKPIQNEEEVKPPNNPQDAVQEQQLNNPSTDEPIVPAAETTSEVEQPQTTNDKQETENMEVHHHAHNPAAPHHKKNWKSYFWEFLMLFLAVFCGFLAEYQLEHKIERDREKKFIQTFIEDLKTDTVDINRVLIFHKQKKERMDSLMLLLSTGQIKRHENELYFFGRTLVRTSRFISNDRTITQLKNSGSLRLIRNKQAADSMMAYQSLVGTIYTNQEDDRIERRAADPILSSMFNPFVFDKMVDINGVNRLSDRPPLRSYDPAIQQDLAYYVHQLKGSNFILQQRLALLNEKAKNIMAFLQKEYHLK